MCMTRERERESEKKTERERERERTRQRRREIERKSKGETETAIDTETMTTKKKNSIKHRDRDRDKNNGKERARQRARKPARERFVERCNTKKKRYNTHPFHSSPALNTQEMETNIQKKRKLCNICYTSTPSPPHHPNKQRLDNCRIHTSQLCAKYNTPAISALTERG